MYILSGVENDKNIIIDDCFEVDKHIVMTTCERFEIDKRYLYACMKTLRNLRKACVIIHTHPLQNEKTLKESEYDRIFFENISSYWRKLSRDLHIIFGIMCGQHVIFKVYEDSCLKDVEWESKYIDCNEECWQLEIIYNEKYEYGIVCSNKSKRVKKVKKNDAEKILEWKKRYERNELTKLQELAYKKFITDNFEVFSEPILTSGYSYNKSGVINELVFMIQLGCNLRCKYCYAHGGTYDYGEHMVLEPESGKKIVDSLISKNVQNIKKVTFIGGEPSMFPETIGKMCDYINTLADTGVLSNKPRYYMVTNGVHFTKLMYYYIKIYNIKLTISLDGRQEVNDQLRIKGNGEGTFFKVLATIDRLRQQGTEPVMIESTYTSIHENENITRNQVIDELRKITGIKNILVADCEGEYAPKSRGMGIDYEKDLEELYDTCKLCGIACKNGMYNDLYCGAGYQNMAILNNGDYYPCHRFVSDKTMKLGNVFDDEKLEILSLINKNNNKKCVQCWAVNFCKDCNWNIYQGKDFTCQKRLHEIREKLLFVFNIDDIRRKELENILA